MNYVEVIGGVKHKREIAEKVVCWCMNKLLPRYRTLDVTVNLTNCFKTHGTYGYCLSITDREFEIEIDKSLSLREFIETICHEMVHVKQYAKGEMKELSRSQILWKKKVFGDIAYEDAPWEREAFRCEKSLALSCFSETL